MPEQEAERAAQADEEWRQEEQERRNTQEREEWEQIKARATLDLQNQAREQGEMERARSAGREKQVMGYTITMDGLYILPKYERDNGSILGTAFDYMADKVEAMREQNRQEREEREREKIDATQEQYQKTRDEREREKSEKQMNNRRPDRPEQENLTADARESASNLQQNELGSFGSRENSSERSQQDAPAQSSVIANQHSQKKQEAVLEAEQAKQKERDYER